MDPPHPGNRQRTGDATGYLVHDLPRWGPKGTSATPSVVEARQYCQQLCHWHYENFTVVSWLLPRALRQHFCNLYAYCRWADDLADESGDPQSALALLNWWESQLDECLAGRLRHPVYVALRETLLEFEIPDQLLRDLLTAFRRDQRQTRYETWDELLDYCRCSANPVGRLVLRLGRCDSDENGRLSDLICSGLQIANFCQDVARDFERGRIYLPRECWSTAGYDESDFQRHLANEAFRRMMAEAVDRADQLLLAGESLVQRVPRNLRLDVSLFVRGGRDLLRAIRRQRYDVWSRRPTVSRWRKVWLAVRALGALWLK